jgi:hypothetical protein
MIVVASLRLSVFRPEPINAGLALLVQKRMPVRPWDYQAELADLKSEGE